MTVNVTLLIGSTPYGTDGPYNALRLAESLLGKGAWVELFLIGDGVHTARAGQDPKGAFASVEAMLTAAIEAGAVVTLCGTCCAARGIAESDVVKGARFGTIHDLADLTIRSERVLSF